MARSSERAPKINLISFRWETRCLLGGKLLIVNFEIKCRMTQYLGGDDED